MTVKEIKYNGYRRLLAIDSEGNFNVVGTYLDSELQEFLKTYDPPKDFNIYYDKHSYKSRKARFTERNILGLKEFFIDIDLHKTKDTELEKAKEVIYNNFKDYDLLFTKVNDSGRGLHYVLEIEQASFVLIYLYRLIAEKLEESYSKALREIKEQYSLPKDLKVDAGTLRPNGIRRLEGSYNLHTGTRVTTLYNNNQKENIIDLATRLGIATRYNDLEKQAKKNRRKNKTNRKPNSAIQRAEFILYKTPKAKVGQRNRYIFLLYNHLKRYHKQPMQVTIQYNNSLKNPISNNELQNIFKGCNELHYNFTNEKFYQWLEVERPIMKTDLLKEEYRIKRIRRESRNKEIIKLLKTTNKTHQEIANTIGNNTTRRIVQELARNNNLGHRERKKLLKQNKSLNV